jgi:hypothetical protein
MNLGLPPPAELPPGVHVTLRGRLPPNGTAGSPARSMGALLSSS